MLHRSLRTGDLTEELCPVTLLREISKLAAAHGLKSLNVNWYYENVAVEPLMIKAGLMTFKVTLPYTNSRLYERYDIQTFAVPITNDGSRARVQVQRNIAMDTTNGYWFAPTLCTGRRPQLCHAGPRWRDAFPCERGLVTGHEPDRKECVLTTTRTNDTTAQELLEGVFILQTLGEDVRLACKGHRQEQTTLTRGVYRLQLNEGCTLSGGRWGLHGVVRRYITASADIPLLEVPRLDLIALMRAVPQLNDTDSSVDLNFNDINDNYVPKYESMDNDGYPEVLVAHHLSWTAIGLITVLCILCVIGSGWLYRRRQKIRFFFADAVLDKVQAKRVKTAVKYDTKKPEEIKVIEDVESATGEITETV